MSRTTGLMQIAAAVVGAAAASQVITGSKADAARAAGDATVLDNHRVVRDGEHWTCLHCKGQWPFPSPLPADPGPCVPRTWGAQ